MWTMAWTQSVCIALVCSILGSGVWSDAQRISSTFTEVEDQLALESHLPVHHQPVVETKPKVNRLQCRNHRQNVLILVVGMRDKF
jgi:hypothetical protein